MKQSKYVIYKEVVTTGVIVNKRPNDFVFTSCFRLLSFRTNFVVWTFDLTLLANIA